MNRRSLFGLLVAGGGAVVAALVGLPALLLGISPVLQERRGTRWRPLGEVANFPPGRVHVAAIPPERQQWPRIIGGETYQFCCPPCIDEFVRLAKQQPGQILPPANYVK